MSNDTDFKLKFSCPTLEQLEHVLAYLNFKKRRWDSWKARGGLSSELEARVGAQSAATVVSWGFDIQSEIQVTRRSGRASVVATAWANQNFGNIHISGDDGEIADLRRRFSFLRIKGRYKDEYGDIGDV